VARNLKALGLALCATLALGAVVASAASGQATEKKFHSEIEKTTLTSTALGAQRFITGPEEEVKCNKIGLSATVATKTATEIKVIPHYSECTVKIPGVPVLPGHVDTNTCYYTFTIETEVEAHHKYSGQLHISCTEPGDSIKITTTFLGGKQTCMEIPEQTLTSPSAVDYTNEGVGEKSDIKVLSTVTGITYTKTSICGSGTFNNTEYIGEGTVKGEEDKVGGAQVGIWIT
jgi:hypothetical protein